MPSQKKVYGRCSFSRLCVSDHTHDSTLPCQSRANMDPDQGAFSVLGHSCLLLPRIAFPMFPCFSAPSASKIVRLAPEVGHPAKATRATYLAFFKGGCFAHWRSLPCAHTICQGNCVRNSKYFSMPSKLGLGMFWAMTGGTRHSAIVWAVAAGSWFISQVVPVGA